MAEKKSLKYFMRSQEPEIVTVPGPKSIKDEDGNVIQLEIKVLTQEQIDNINDAYRRRSMATDKNDNPLIAFGEVVWKVEKDSARVTRHIIAEALQYPDLKSKELMDYYGCFDITEMPRKVFARSDEYQYVSRLVMQTLGLSAKADDKEELETAKN